MTKDEVPRQTHDSPVLEITTLGDFRVRYGERDLTQENNKSYRLWELFKLLLTNRGQGIHPEVIAEKLWPEQEYVDPKSAVSNMIYRLRRMLALAVGEQNASKYILFDQGSYLWNPKASYWLDAAEFESLVHRADRLGKGKREEIIPLLRKAVSLYKGEYLSELLYSEWVLWQRHYYHRLFLESVINLGELLKRAGEYDELIALCEKAMAIDPYQEQIHILYLEALLALGKNQLASSHFRNVSDMLYREMGMRPSQSMTHLYQVIMTDSGIAEQDLTLIQKSLESTSMDEGALFCDSVVFRKVFRLLQRLADRTKVQFALCLLTLIEPNPTGRQELDSQLRGSTRGLLSQPPYPRENPWVSG